MRRFLTLVLVVGIATPAIAAPQTRREARAARRAADRKAAADREAAARTPGTLKGQRVMVIQNGAAVKTQEKGIVWNAYIGEVLTVSIVKDSWLWVFERQGWLSRKHVVPFDTAVYEMNARVAQTPSAENYGLRGVAYLSHDQHAKAIADFNEVLRRNPGDAAAFLNRGNAYRFLNKLPEAIADYNKTLQLNSKHFLALNNRAMVHTELKRYELAMRDLQAAIALNDRYPEAHYNQGVVLEYLGRHENAVTEFTTAISLDENYVLAHVNRAFAHSKLGNYDAARSDLSRAVVLAPNNEHVLNDFAWFLATCKSDEYRDGQKALSMAHTAAQLGEFTSWEVLDTYAAAHAEAGKFKQAEQWAQKALSLAPPREQPRIKSHLVAFRNRKPVRE